MPKKQKPPAEPKAEKRRPAVAYSEQIGDAICEGLAAGRTLKDVCAKESMPDASTVRRWVLNADHPLSAKYQIARTLGLHEMADSLLEIADNTEKDFRPGTNQDGAKIVDEKAINRAKLQIETRRWLLSKLLPRQFGDKVHVDGQVEVQHTLPPLSKYERARRVALILEMAKSEKAVLGPALTQAIGKAQQNGQGAEQAEGEE
jgi:hypothetical protein